MTARLLITESGDLTTVMWMALALPLLLLPALVGFSRWEERVMSPVAGGRRGTRSAAARPVRTARR